MAAPSAPIRARSLASATSGRMGIATSRPSSAKKSYGASLNVDDDIASPSVVPGSRGGHDLRARANEELIAIAGDGTVGAHDGEELRQHLRDRTMLERDHLEDRGCVGRGGGEKRGNEEQGRGKCHEAPLCPRVRPRV